MWSSNIDEIPDAKKWNYPNAAICAQSFHATEIIETLAFWTEPDTAVNYPVGICRLLNSYINTFADY